MELTKAEEQLILQNRAIADEEAEREKQRAIAQASPRDAVKAYWEREELNKLVRKALRVKCKECQGKGSTWSSWEGREFTCSPCQGTGLVDNPLFRAEEPLRVSNMKLTDEERSLIFLQRCKESETE
jgi:DnaJ-class molecular chaperone